MTKNKKKTEAEEGTVEKAKAGKELAKTALFSSDRAIKNGDGLIYFFVVILIYSVVIYLILLLLW